MPMPTRTQLMEEIKKLGRKPDKTPTEKKNPSVRLTTEPSTKGDLLERVRQLEGELEERDEVISDLEEAIAGVSEAVEKARDTLPEYEEDESAEGNE